jgi:hypothetical protein
MRIVPTHPCLRVALCAALLTSMAAYAARPDGNSGEPNKPAKNSSSSPANPQAVEKASLYEGPGSCAATSCHGSVKPVAGSRIYQDEYSTWIIKDKHARAYQVLTEKLGVRIGKILKLKEESKDAPKCLVCHALYTAPEQRARAFDIKEGVTCENCHGASSAWLGPHTETRQKHEDSVKYLHMVDTRNVIVRTQKCLECHLGSPDKFVDHEMIAAGHPDLYFELDSFSAVMPRHWKVPREAPAGKPDEDGAWVGVRDWSTGQAVQLSADMKRLIWRAKGERYDLDRKEKIDVWPEYSELSCVACHHSLGPALSSWRQEHAYVGRRPGDPAWNNSRYAVFRLLAKQVDSASAQELDRHLLTVSTEMSRLNPDRNTVTSAAAAAEPLAIRIAERLSTMQYDPAVALRMMQRITEDADQIALDDESAAEQAAMALDSLYIAYSRDTKPANAAEVRAAINELFKHVEMRSDYNADQFASSLRHINGMLH